MEQKEGITLRTFGKEDHEISWVWDEILKNEAFMRKAIHRRKTTKTLLRAGAFILAAMTIIGIFRLFK